MSPKWPRKILLAEPEAPGHGEARALLRGVSILWTRPVESNEALAEALVRAGAEVLEAPAIEFASFVEKNIKQCRKMLEGLRDHRGWLILPSPTAVGFFRELLGRTHLDPSALEGVRVAAIGQASAEALAAAGLRADFLPPTPRGSALAETLPAEPGEPVVIAGSSQTRPELREGLEGRGLNVQFLPLYAPCPCRGGLRAIGKLLAKDARRIIVATSPSAVDAIMESLGETRELAAEALWVAIGPTTHRRLLDCQVSPDAIAEAAAPDAAGILAAAEGLVLRLGARRGAAE